MSDKETVKLDQSKLRVGDSIRLPFYDKYLLNTPPFKYMIFNNTGPKVDG